MLSAGAFISKSFSGRKKLRDLSLAAACCFLFHEQKSETGPGRERSAPRLPPLHSPALGHRHRQGRSEATAALRLSDWSHGEPARRWTQEPRRQPDLTPPVPPTGLNRTGPGRRAPGCSAAPAARLHLDRADWLPAAAAALLLAAPRRARRLSHSAPSAPPRRWPSWGGGSAEAPRPQPAPHPRAPATASPTLRGRPPVAAAAAAVHMAGATARPSSSTPPGPAAPAGWAVPCRRWWCRGARSPWCAAHCRRAAPGRAGRAAGSRRRPPQPWRSAEGAGLPGPRDRAERRPPPGARPAPPGPGPTEGARPNPRGGQDRRPASAGRTRPGFHAARGTSGQGARAAPSRVGQHAAVLLLQPGELSRRGQLPAANTEHEGKRAECRIRPSRTGCSATARQMGRERRDIHRQI